MSNPDSANSSQAPTSAATDESKTLADPNLADSATVAEPDVAATEILEPRSLPQLPDVFTDPTIADGPDQNATIAEPVSTGDQDVTMLDPTGPTKPASLASGNLSSKELIQSTFIPRSNSSNLDSFGMRATKPADSSGQITSPAKSASKGLPASERYRLKENFAHGGLGNIWLAEDQSLRRHVAFKELLPKALRNKVIVERFLEEAQITGQLEHPGIVPIYDIGYQENGTPFYAMKLLKGGNMDQAIEAMHELPRGGTERQLAFTRLLRQFVAVCQAVGFAHEKGVLHRDLKPMNVMLGEFGETLVLDWGLAKLVDIIGERQVQSDRADANAPDDDFLNSDALDETATLIDRISAEQITRTAIGKGQEDASRAVSNAGTVNSMNASRAANAPTLAATGQRQVTTSGRSAGSQTLMGQVMGTPAYMPPEQAEGRIDLLDARTDIYSLGGILYKLLTNQQPVPRGKMKDVMQLVIEGRIPPPRELDPSVPEALDAICRKAMAREQSDRYPTAMQLAADVENWLADEPVSCYAEPWLEQARRWVKRHWTFVVSSGAVLVVLGVGTSLWSVVENRRVAGLRSAALAKSDEAKSAIESSDFARATTLLTEALGQVKSEQRLTDVRSSLESRLDDVSRLQAAAERERIGNIRQKAERRLTEITADLDAGTNLPNSKVVLTEVVTLLANEPSLSDVRAEADKWLKAVDLALSMRSEIDAAAVRFTQFEQAVEQTRIFGGRISGDDSLDDVRQSREHGLAALETFAIDFNQPDKLDERLMLLPEESKKKWRSGVAEVLVTLAQLEMKIVTTDDPDKQKEAARRALAKLSDAEKFGGATQPLWFLRADLHFALGDTDAEKQAQQAADKLEPQTRLDHFLLGERSRAQRKYDDALRHYQDALRVDPDDFWSLNLMGLCHLLSNRHAAAAASYTACISRRPDFIWPYLTRAVAFGELKQFENAYRDFDKALELDKQSYAAYLNRGYVRVLEKKFSAAQTDFEKAAQLRPDLCNPVVNLAEVAWQSGNHLLENDSSPAGVTRARAEFEKGAVLLTKALKLSPLDPTVYYFRGQIQISLFAIEAGLADLDRAIRLEFHPRRRAASFKLIGLTHQRLKHWEPALSAFDQSLALNPDDHEVIRQRAEVLLTLTRWEAAINGFTEFLKRNGPDADAYRGRGSAYAKVDKYREAINDYTMSLQFEPSPNMLARRGWAYLNNAAKLAKEDFEAAVSLNADNPDAHQGLAYALVMLGDHAGAVEEVEKSAAGIPKAIEKYGASAWPMLLNPASVFAQAVAKVSIDPKLEADRREVLTKKYSTRAVELLIEAHRVAGAQFRPALLNAAKTDSSLDPIRQRPEFLDAWKKMEADSQ